MRKKSIFMTMAVTAMLFASCADKTNKAENSVTTADTTQVAPEKEVAPESTASVVGVWKLSAIDLDMVAPKGKEQALEDMKKKMIAETVYTFNDDGTMTFKNSMVKETPATYTFEDNKITMTDNKSKKSETVAVDELTANKLVVSSEQNGKKTVMTFSK
ncbi:lipocalin-like domain-containing protein [Flavobacterium phycosphaerae]|uniref:lipocalin family protein n=1 Tax=Flavobacterium phycosphaerae TaxID=2697515 RepID=UPI00138A4E65|nr:lipocalin family protein [Flavobacterium phycosphaerae]